MRAQEQMIRLARFNAKPAQPSRPFSPTEPARLLPAFDSPGRRQKGKKTGVGGQLGRGWENACPRSTFSLEETNIFAFLSILAQDTQK